MGSICYRAKSSMNFAASSEYRGDGRCIQHLQIMQNIDKLSFRPTDKVLDVGCGSGEETRSIATKVSSVTAIDSSEEMIAEALENFSAPNITYSIGKAQSLGDNPDWKENFHKVVSFFVLHWIPVAEMARTMEGIISCLKPGGEGLFLMDNDDNHYSIVCRANYFLRNHPRWGGFIKDFKRPLYVWKGSLQDAEKLMKDCGCTSAQCEIKQLEMSLSETQIKSFMKATLGETSLIPSAEQDAFLDDLWDWALSSYEDKTQPGHVRICEEGLVIHATK